MPPCGRTEYILSNFEKQARQRPIEETDAAPSDTSRMREVDLRTVLSTINRKETPKDGDLPIGTEEIDRAFGILQKYRTGKTNLSARIIDNEEFWKRHTTGHDDEGKGRRHHNSAWLFNSVANKHADAMDNTPGVNVLPREKGDSQTASMLTSILPVILDQNGFEKTYSACWYDKLICGTCIIAVLWDPTLMNGVGDISVCKVDPLSIYFEPGVTNIQSSENLFHVELRSNSSLEREYPQHKDHFKAGASFETDRYRFDDAVDTSEKTAVIDWYYKVKDGTRTLLHYCKFANGVVLFSSENELAKGNETMADGWYSDGEYPFECDVMYPLKGTPFGFGQVDVCRGVQSDIDLLSGTILEHANQAAKKRYFVRSDGALNEKEFADLSKPFVHFSGSGDPRESIFPIESSPLSEIYVAIQNNMIQELKETSQNNDFSQGGTTSGVTAASAIAALQEAGSKGSRDMIKNFYKTYEKVCLKIISRIAQFYDTPRTFRIIGEGKAAEYVEFSNTKMQISGDKNVFGVNLGARRPLFDVSVKSQKESPFSRLAQNELGVQFYGMGIFNPENADISLSMLEMMEFEGKDAVIDRIQKNAVLPRLRETVMKFAQLILADHPELAPGITQILMSLGLTNGTRGSTQPHATTGDSPLHLKTNPLGEAVRTSAGNTAATAANRAAEMASIK